MTTTKLEAPSMSKGDFKIIDILTFNNKLTQRELNNHVGGSSHNLGLRQSSNKPGQDIILPLYWNIREYSLGFLI